ncbi:MAG: glycosyltransferase [Candidatus Nanopelagicales bacterium]
MTAEVVFVHPPGSSFFMRELGAVVVDAVQRAGGRARLVTGALPPSVDDAGEPVVPVVIPHEFLALGGSGVAPDRLRTSIALNVEHPGSDTFERAARGAGLFGAVFDINEQSRDELRSRGLRVEPFQLGWSPVWDRWGGQNTDRPVDVVVLATHDRARDARLGPILLDLADLEQRVVMAADEVVVEPGGEAVGAEAKWSLLASSRVLLNAHRAGTESFEWVRALEAMCNGAVVVTEPSTDLAPARPGEHLLVASGQEMAAAVRGLVEDPDAALAVRSAAYDLVRGLDVRKAGARLAQAADDLTRRRSRRGGRRSRRGIADRPQPPTDGAPSSQPPVWTPASWLPGSKFTAPHVRVPGSLEVLDRVGAAAARRARCSGDPAPDRVLRPFRGHRSVAVVLVANTGSEVPRSVVDAFVAGTLIPGFLVMGAADDDRGAGWTRNAWIRRLPESVTCVQVQDGSLLPVPDALRQLVGALAEPGADVAYGAVVEPDGISATLDPLPHRLARHAYLDGPGLWRREVLHRLGGFAVDPWVDGLEDHDLWCRAVDHGSRHVRLGRVLWERVVVASPWAPYVDDPETVLTVLEERSPWVMRRDPYLYQRSEATTAPSPRTVRGAAVP